MVSCLDRPCPVCKHPMTGRQNTGCSGKCRAEASRKRKAQAQARTQAERDGKVRDLLEQALEVLGEKDSP